jgi:serine/threonine-protein kinase HipA
VAKVAAAEPITERERAVLRTGGSFGGAKPKALIEIGGEQWVVKFFNNVDSPLIEHATTAGATSASTASQLALHCVRPLPPGRSLRWATRHWPCCCVAEGDANAQDTAELFRRMVFNILADNTDDREKNHSLLAVSPGENGRFRLAPAYDVLPSNSGQGRQEFVCGDVGHDSTLENAMSRCQSFGLSSGEAALQVEQIITVVDTWKEHFAACGVTPGDIEQLEQRVDGEELLGQRRTFAASNYAATPARRLRRVDISHDGYLLGSYRIATAPEPNSTRLTSFKSTCFDSPANNVGPWPASLGCTTNSYSSINPSSANASGNFTPPTSSPLPDFRLSC